MRVLTAAQMREVEWSAGTEIIGARHANAAARRI
jgi:hypothetical protein